MHRLQKGDMLVKDGMRVILLTYVDGLALFGDETLIAFVKDELRKYFTITDLGPTKFFLGVSIDETKDRIILTQKLVIKKIIQDANLTDAEISKTPLSSSHDCTALNCSLRHRVFKK